MIELNLLDHIHVKAKHTTENRIHKTYKIQSKYMVRTTKKRIAYKLGPRIIMPITIVSHLNT